MCGILFKALNKALPMTYGEREKCVIDGCERCTEHIFVNCKITKKVRQAINILLAEVQANPLGDDRDEWLLQRSEHPIQSALLLNLTQSLGLNWCKLTHDEEHPPLRTMVKNLTQQVMQKMEISLIIHFQRENKRSTPSPRHPIEDLFVQKGERFLFKYKQMLADV
eukprot:TRINITY_DN9911_c1_g1_i2.p1 TRINITY_DN9911_c1_g1~~TRINITY_DN9911_c1_g1_i2.p1  ORF type:complete len:166 (+),score=7.81 TRINITY_DN9911_c1_g1_i2:128-625(+)